MKAERLNKRGDLLVSNDAECIRILTEQGVLDLVRPKPPHNQASHAFEHNGYYCLAVCHAAAAN